MRFVPLTLIALAATACVAEPESTMTPAESVATEMPTMDEILASGGKADLWDDIELCHYVCKETRGTNRGCFGQPECARFCGEHATSLRSDALIAYVMCAIENPLCYQTMESCMWSRLWGHSHQQRVVVDGYGFGPDEGSKVYATLDFVAAGGDTEGIVYNGSFSLTWDVEHQGTQHLALYYVDRDDDGVCTPGVDLTGSETFHAAGDWLDPYYHLTVQPEESSRPGWECEYLNQQ